MFYLILFLGFFLPTNSNFYLPLPGVLLKVNEVAFILLPIINMFCYSRYNVIIHSPKLKKNILLLIIAVVFTEVVLKNIFFDQSVGEAIKSIRVGLPLFSSLIILRQGIRADIQIVWNTLLVAISVSVTLSIVSLFTDLPIYYDLESGTSILEDLRGRVMNSNTYFGLIGLYLLIQGNNNWYSRGKLVKITSVLSVISVILSFNRTFLALLFLEAIYLMWFNFNFKKSIKIAFYGLGILAIFFGAYLNNDIIKNQIDRRILSIIIGEESLSGQTIENNREIIYYGVQEKIESGYFLIGLPFKTPIYTWPARYSVEEDMDMTVTDTTVFTLLLRYGILPLVLAFVIFNQMYSLSKNSFFRTILVLFLISSLNLDSLLRLNSILFLVLIFIINKSKIYE
jgi:hypothetical protein